MKNLSLSNKSDFQTQTLPTLPETFWAMCSETLRAWKRMDLVLSREWETLKTRDLTGLWQIAEEKKMLSKRIGELESRLASTVDRILVVCGREGGDSRWNNLRGVVNRNDIKQLEKWKVDRNLCRDEILQTNTRLHRWVSGQLKVVRHLTDVMNGSGQREITTYRPSGRPGNLCMRTSYRQGIV
ncbi:MAG: hypothetical protein BA864_02350 [Desulfuromonadales bacterium C00003093]|nr:MAG: hypothetical protein BA864_02350 [Desulfuromonadales bacterium C00003093]